MTRRTWLDTQYLTWINAARTAGHRVKGYVYAGYGQRAMSAVLAAAVARNRRFAGFFATNQPFTTGLPTYWARQTALAVCS